MQRFASISYDLFDYLVNTLKRQGTIGHIFIENSIFQWRVTKRAHTVQTMVEIQDSDDCDVTDLCANVSFLMRSLVRQAKHLPRTASFVSLYRDYDDNLVLKEENGHDDTVLVVQGYQFSDPATVEVDMPSFHLAELNPRASDSIVRALKRNSVANICLQRRFVSVRLPDPDGLKLLQLRANVVRARESSGQEDETIADCFILKHKHLAAFNRLLFEQLSINFHVSDEIVCVSTYDAWNTRWIVSFPNTNVFMSHGLSDE